MLISAAGSALAQPVDGAPRGLGHLRLGPVVATPSVALREIGIDSNVFRTATDPKSDFTFTVGPQLDLRLGSRRYQVVGRAGADFVYFSQFASERSVNGDGELRGDLRLRRFDLFVEGSMLNTRQRPNFEIDGRSRRMERALGGGVDVAVSRRLGVELALRRSDLRYEADEVFLGTNLSEVLNRESAQRELTVRYEVSPLTSVALAARWESDDFTRSPERNADSFALLPAVEFTPKALISGRAQVGYRRFRTLDPTLPGYAGIVADVGLGYRFGDRTRVTLDVLRDVRYSYEPLEPYFVVNSIGGSATQQIARRFDLSVGTSRLSYSYRTFDGLGSVVARPARVDLIHTYSASVGYRLGRGTRIGFGGSLYVRDSNQPGRSYEGLRFGTDVTYGF